jgi:hypothetical protein
VRSGFFRAYSVTLSHSSPTDAARLPLAGGEGVTSYETKILQQNQLDHSLINLDFHSRLHLGSSCRYAPVANCALMEWRIPRKPLQSCIEFFDFCSPTFSTKALVVPKWTYEFIHDGVVRENSRI